MYLSQNQSNIMKAIAMLLIIIGHNHILAPNDGSSTLFNYLYQFHVSTFFILPFFYNKHEKLNWQSISKIIVRNGIPYILFFTTCYGLYHFIIIKDGYAFSTFFKGIIEYPGFTVKSVTGFYFIWFLPVFMIMSIIKLIGNYRKYCMIILCIIGLAIFNTNYGETPFYICRSLVYYTMGIFAYYLSKYIKNIDEIGCLFFFILSILFWTDIYKANYIIFSISAFFTIKKIVSIIDFQRIPFLSLIGKYSLPIYLTHVFIYNVLERILPHTLIWGILIYLITIGLSLSISIVIYKIEVVRKFLFPKSWKEWIHFYQMTKALN